MALCIGAGNWVGSVVGGWRERELRVMDRAVLPCAKINLHKGLLTLS